MAGTGAVSEASGLNLSDAHVGFGRQALAGTLAAGVTTAILTEAQNIASAAPINLVREVIPRPVQSGRPVRPWPGAQGRCPAPALRDLLRIELVDRLLAEAAEPGSSRAARPRGCRAALRARSPAGSCGA